MNADVGFFKRRISSFAYAFRGLRILIQTQTNARIHLAATVLVTGVGFLFGLTPSDWAILTLAMGMVWTAEAVNTAIELTVDLVSPEHHELAGKAKDVAAAAVLLSALTAITIACCVFLGPNALRLFT